MARVLYITYDGVLEPLGQSQVLNYLKALSLEHKIFLLSFEKKKDLTSFSYYNSMKKECEDLDIKWVHLNYHKSSFRTYFDIFKGVGVSFYICLKNRVDIVHSRSYLPALIALILNKSIKRKFIFDMRGLWADEKVDSGMWKKTGYLYKLVKALEKYFLINADEVISLTKSGESEIRKFGYLKDKEVNISVIRTCTDLEKFKPRKKDFSDQTPNNEEFILGYVGSVSLWYNFSKVIFFFKKLKKVRPNSILSIVNNGEHEEIKEKLKSFSLNEDSYILESKKYKEVPSAMQNMDAGIFLLEPFYSKVASAPTKLGEFLAMGIPCVTSKNIGDVESILDEGDCGVVLSSFDDEYVEKCVKDLINLSLDLEVKQRCRNTAKKYFSLKEGVVKYSELYKNLC